MEDQVLKWTPRAPSTSPTLYRPLLVNMGGGIKMMGYLSAIKICSMTVMKGFSRHNYSPKPVDCELNVRECVWIGLAIPREPFKEPGALLEESKCSRCSPAGLGATGALLCAPWWGGEMSMSQGLRVACRRWAWPLADSSRDQARCHTATRSEFRQ